MNRWTFQSGGGSWVGRARPRAIRSVSAGLLATVVGACIPDPHGDYDRFVDDTADMRKTANVDAGPIDAAAPVEAVEGLYYGACLASLAFGRIDRLLRFHTQTSFVPEGSGGKLKLTLIPLTVQADTVSLANTIGDPIITPESAVAADGAFTADLGTAGVPGEANPISGRPIVIEGTKLTGRFGSKDRFCAELDGQVTVPIRQTLNDPGDICLFLPLNEGDAIPTLTKEEFVCQ